ncbi:MAG: Bacillopeptidase F [Anaerolineales bacterium]|nr:Bacillopeptidase F [Anaerolineales bacterium]
MNLRRAGHIITVVLSIFLFVSSVSAAEPLGVGTLSPAQEGDSSPSLLSPTPALPSSLTPAQENGSPLPKLPPAALAKIDPQLLKQITAEGESTFIVYLQEQADLSAAIQIERLDERRLAVFNTLQSTAERSQRDILAYLRKQEQAGRARNITPFWIFDGLAVIGDGQVLAEVASRDDVVKIRPDRVHELEEPIVEQAPGPEPQTALWNIKRIRANEVWNELGITGRGVVVAGMDTGVDWEHNALHDTYRGKDGDHNYDWFDFTETYPNSANDGHGHGTHTMGTIVGDGVDASGQRLQTGVAPGAQWVAVKIFTDGTPATTTDAWIHGAFQWMMAPTDLNGENPDPTQAPDIVNNSWGSVNGADQTFRPDVQALRAAGIVPIFSAGNSGELGRGSVGSPGSFPASIAIGATEPDPLIASFSGQGPSFWNEVKPEFSAPGQSIRSTIPGDKYSVLGGTSMAAPHASGAMALMLEGAKAAAEQRVLETTPTAGDVTLQEADPIPSVDDLEQLLALTAVDIEAPGPDSVAGAGRIDTYRATLWAMTAGKLYGFLRDSETGAPIADATIAGASLTNPDDAFTTTSTSEGEYSVAVPKGRYSIEVDAFGYAPRTLSGIEVVAGFLTLVLVVVNASPTGTVVGGVKTADGTPIQSTIEVLDTPVTVQTDRKGSYRLDLPAGTYTLHVAPPGYRAKTAQVTIVVGERTNQPFILTPAPSTLFVNADHWNDNVDPYYTIALEKAGIPFDTRPITSTENTPTATDLSAYDVVVWAHPWSSPGVIDQEREDTATVDALTGYLEQGGRLLLTGQDIAWLDGGGNPSVSALPYFGRFLHAEFADNSAPRSSSITGAPDEIMSGVHLEFDTDFAYKRSTQPGWFSPDEIEPADELAHTIFEYDDGAGAGIKVQDDNYRIVYLSFAADTTGPREQLADTMAHAYDWLSQPVLTKSVDLPLAAPGTRLTYTITLQNGVGIPLDGVTIADPLPEDIKFVLNSATGGAVYNRDRRTIEWSGSIPPRERAIITFQADLADDLAGGSTVTNVAESHDLQLTAAASTQILGPDLSASTKKVDKALVSAGETMTYTLRLLNASPRVTATGTSLIDPIPDSTHYVDGSVTGGAAYDPDTQEIQWSGDVPVAAPKTAPYTWADSDAEGGPAFAWDSRAEEQGQPVAGMGDDTTSEEIPIGFALPFFDGEFTSFRVSSNGFLSFTSTDAPFSNDPLPSEDAPGNLVAPFWDDLTLTSQGTVYAWTNNTDTLVVSWVDVPHFGGSEGYTFQAILHADGDIVFQYRELGAETTSATVGIQNSDGSAGVQIAHNEEYVHEELAILLQPPQPAAPPPVVTFAVRVNEDVASGSVITNTAQVDDGHGQVFALTTTSRTNITELRSSRKLAPKVVLPGGALTYTLTISNTGRLPANVTLSDPVPAGVQYQPDSVTGGATYDEVSDTIQWTGEVPPFQGHTLTFAVTANPDVEIGTTITNTATLDDGVTAPFDLVATTQVVSADLSRSTKLVDHRQARSGDVLTYTIWVANNSSVEAPDVSLIDRLPEGLTLLPDSLSTNATFDPAENAIRWNGALPARGEGYAWDDSESPAGPAFDWDDRAETLGVPVSDLQALGDDTIAGPFSIGFSFPFFEQNVNEFYVSSNGFLTFNPATERYFSNRRLPEPDVGQAPGNLVAVFWDDLDPRSAGEIYYWTDGAGTLVVSWTDIPHLARGGPYTFQAILQSDGTLRFQYKDVDEGRIDEATVGIQNADGTEGITIAHDEPYVEDEMAVRVAPPTGTEQIEFQARIADEVPLETTLVNTAVIKDRLGNDIEREAKTVVNTIDLSGAAMHASAGEVSPGGHLTYQLVIPNAGTADAAGAVIVNPLPAGLAYVEGSATGGATYHAAQREIRWTGSVPAGDEITFEYSVDVVPPLADGTTISNSATIDDGLHPALTRSTEVQVLAPDLSRSTKQAWPMVARGDALAYHVSIVNSGHAPASVTFTDRLPADMAYVAGSAEASYGEGVSFDADTGTLAWSGTVPARGIAKISFSVLATGDAGSVTNVARLDDGLGTTVSLEATTRVVPYSFRLPVLLKNR